MSVTAPIELVLDLRNFSERLRGADEFLALWKDLTPALMGRSLSVGDTPQFMRSAHAGTQRPPGALSHRHQACPGEELPQRLSELRPGSFVLLGEGRADELVADAALLRPEALTAERILALARDRAGTPA